MNGYFSGQTNLIFVMHNELLATGDKQLADVKF